MPAKMKAFLVGVGMTKFEKPGSRENFDYPQMVKESVTKALSDANLHYTDIEQACAGYVYGDSTCGQRSLYEMGLTGIPVYNVNNNCATGSTALMLAYNLIQGGFADCVLAVGFEKMEKGSLGSKFDDRENPIAMHLEVLTSAVGFEAAPVTAQMFGAAGREHMQKYGTKPEHFAKIAVKNHKHSCNNPYSQFQQSYSLDEILKSPEIYKPLTKLQCCPTSDGSASVILASEKFVEKHKLRQNCVEVLGMEMSTDLPSTFAEKSCIKMVGFDMTKNAARKLFNKVGVKPDDVDVIELHDCFSTNELITYEALGLCKPGEGGKLVDSNDNTYGGKYVVNPSGGLISKGHPLGATGVAQCVELCWQLRGMAGKRQVPNAKLALQHNIGLGGACVVALYKKLPNKSDNGSVVSDTGVDDRGKDFKVSRLFKIIGDQMKEGGANYVKRMKGIFCFKVTNGPGNKMATWTVDAKNGNGSVIFGEVGKSDVTITMKDDDLFDMMIGKLNPQKAFMSKKLTIKGKMALALRLRELKPSELRSKL